MAPKTTPPRVPGYELGARIGRGGNADVWEARELRGEGRRVALKIAREPGYHDRYLDEFRLLRRLAHSTLTRAFDFGRIEENDRYWIALERIDGSDLLASATELQLESGERAPAELIALFLQVASGLEYLHRQGLLHLDLKPSNVLCRVPHAKLIDLGAAMQRGRTPTGAIACTPAFCAPEVARGGKPTASSDLFSLGATLRCCLVGELPTSDPGISQKSPDAREPIADIPKKLDELVARLSDPVPDRRPRDAGEVLQKLELLLESRSQPWVLREEPDFRGREAELQDCLGWLDRVHAGEGPGLFAIHGGPDLGKTRLVDAVVTEARAMEIETIEISATGRVGEPVLRRLVRSLLRTRSLARAEVEPFRFLLDYFDIESDPASQRDQSRQPLARTHARVVRDAWRLVDAIGCDRALLLVLEDLHLADALAREWLLRLDAEVPKTLGILTTSREDPRPDRTEPAEGIDCRTAVLGPLDVPSAEATLASQQSTLPRQVIARILSVSEGYPGQIARHLQQAIDTFRGSTRPRALPPETLARLQSLSRNSADDARRVLLSVALAAMPLDEESLARLLEIELRTVRRALAELTGRGYLSLSSSGYFVPQDIDPSVLIASFDTGEKRQAHARLARFLEKSPERRARAALHFQLAGDHDRAAPLLEDSLDWLRSPRHSYEAIELCEEILRHPLKVESHVALHELLADHLLRVGRLGEACARLEALLRQRAGDLPQAMRILRKLGTAQQRIGDTEAARRAYLLASERVQDREPAGEVLDLYYELAAFHLFTGRLDLAEQQARGGFEMLESPRAEDLDARSRAACQLKLRSVLGNVALRQFRYEEAITEFRAGLKCAEKALVPSDESVLLNNLGLAYRQSNRLRQALEINARASRLAMELADDMALFSIRCNEAAVLGRMGRAKEAADILGSLERQPVHAESKRAQLFLLFTRGLTRRFDPVDQSALWSRCKTLAHEIDDPAFARFADLHLLENELREGRLHAARRIVAVLESGGGDPQVQAARDARAAWLEALLGHEQEALGILERMRTRWTEDIDEHSHHAQLVDALFEAAALLELYQSEAAATRLEALESIFAAIEEVPALTECGLMLAELHLRRGDLASVRGQLDSIRGRNAARDAATDPRPADPRVAALELRLAIASDESSLADVQRSASDLRQCLSPHVDSELCWQVEWLVEIASGSDGLSAASEVGRRASMPSSSRLLRDRFLEELSDADRQAYLARDHARRLGVSSLTSERKSADATGRSARRLFALQELVETEDAYRALRLLVEASDAQRALLLLDGRSRPIASLGFEDVEKRELSHLISRLQEVGTGPLEEGLCLELWNSDESALGAVYLGPGRATSSAEAYRSRMAFLSAFGAVLSSSPLYRSLARRQRAAEIETNTADLDLTRVIPHQSESMQRLMDLVQRTTDSDLPILLTGESGVGKDWLAQWIHNLGKRRRFAFRTQNCAAVPESLLEADLFGFEEGAFSGADRGKTGYIHEADQGTFYLDGVDSLTLATQGKLLRVLDEQTIRPLGSNLSHSIDVRFVASTQRELEPLVENGLFRRDLYYRLAGLTLRIPPLRERLEDLPALIDHFSSTKGNHALHFEDDALLVLHGHSWPGNLRELETLVRRLCLLNARVVRADDVRRALDINTESGEFPRWIFRRSSYDEAQRAFRRAYLIHLFETSKGDMKTISETLGTTRRNAYLRFKRAGLSIRDLRTRFPQG